MKKAFYIILLLLVLVLVAVFWRKQPADVQQEPEENVPQREISVPSFDEAVSQMPEIEGWKTTIDGKKGYLLMHPEEFVVGEEAVVEDTEEIEPDDDEDGQADEEEDDEDGQADEDGEEQEDEQANEEEQEIVNIQITSQVLSPDLKWFGDLKQHLLEAGNDLTQPAQEVQLGQYVVLSQYFSYGGSGEQYNKYFAYGPEEREYFEIKILEPSFSENREAIEKMLETFTIFK